MIMLYHLVLGLFGVTVKMPATGKQPLASGAPPPFNGFVCNESETYNDSNSYHV